VSDEIKIDLPPQPNVKDFVDDKGTLREGAYKTAMEAWRGVCRDLIQRQTAKDFFG
jgi:hypothetical protein